VVKSSVSGTVNFSIDKYTLAVVLLAGTRVGAAASSQPHVVATIYAGNIPASAEVDRTTHQAYATNYRANTVKVIDEASDSAIAIIDLPQFSAPLSGAGDWTTHQVYVANGESRTVLARTLAMRRTSVLRQCRTWSVVPERVTRVVRAPSALLGFGPDFGANWHEFGTDQRAREEFFEVVAAALAHSETELESEHGRIDRLCCRLVAVGCFERDVGAPRPLGTHVGELGLGDAGGETGATRTRPHLEGHEADEVLQRLTISIFPERLTSWTISQDSPFLP
jgi:hypothetical protein